MDINTTMTNENIQANASKKRLLKQAGLGGRLKSARDTLRLSERDAAQRLHLNPNIIALIESEDFENGPPATFMRGYIRSYARLLNFPEEEINAAFIELETHSVQAPGIAPLAKTKTASSPQSYHLIRRSTYLIAAGLIALVSLWWASHPKDTEQVTKSLTALTDSLTTPAVKPVVVKPASAVETAVATVTASPKAAFAPAATPPTPTTPTPDKAAQPATSSPTPATDADKSATATSTSTLTTPGADATVATPDSLSIKPLSDKAPENDDADMTNDEATNNNPVSDNDVYN